MNIHWHPNAPYLEILKYQESIRQGILEGHSQECILTVEHLSCVTLGKRGGSFAKEQLPEGTTIHQINRGGLATWHGPGQAVIYPIIHVRQRKIGVRNFVFGLEETILSWLKEKKIAANRKEKCPGIWIGESKIAAIGLEIKQGISTHGVSINISNSLNGFNAIDPCGFSNLSITTMKNHCSTTPSIQEVGLELATRIRTWIEENSRANC